MKLFKVIVETVYKELNQSLEFYVKQKLSWWFFSLAKWNIFNNSFGDGEWLYVVDVIHCHQEPSAVGQHIVKVYGRWLLLVPG